MRYDTPIFFRKVIHGEYDPNTGNYAADTVKEEMVYASVINTNAETMRLVYGEVKQGSVTAHIQNKVNVSDYADIRIGSDIYTIDNVRDLRTKQVFVLSEAAYGRQD